MSKLKVFRIQEGLTQEDMAEKMRVSKSMYIKVESGTIQASRNFMNAFTEVFPSADLRYIFFGQNST